MTPSLAEQSPPTIRRQMHEELFADDPLSTPNDGSFPSNDPSLESIGDSSVPEGFSGASEDDASDWIDEARREALLRKSIRTASEQPPIEPPVGDSLATDSLEI